jgi:hypothetical protein
MKREPCKQIEHREHLINIFYDECAESPRERNNLGTMYTVGHRCCPEEKLYDHFDIEDMFDSNRDFSDQFLREYIALPIYMYDHGGQTVRTYPFSCRWDSGLFGIIAVPIEEVKKEYKWKLLTKKRRRTIEERLEAEVKIYDDFLKGDIYGFEITRAGTVVESSWGYYGDDAIEGLIADCKLQIDRLCA